MVDNFKILFRNNLNMAYNIGNFIQDQVDKHVSEKKSLDHSCFKLGPQSRIRQLQHGLVLVKREGIPFEIDTPYGSWKIIEGKCCNDEWKKVLKALEGPLGLVLLQEERVSRGALKRPYYAITQWETHEIKWPSYKIHQEYFPDTTIQALWNEFAQNHTF